jgi:hypothetical protein
VVAPTTEVWLAYSASYLDRYQTEPVRNATVNGQFANFVARIGAKEAPAVASWYLRHEGRRYVQGGHSVGLMLHDAEKLRTEWATGRAGNSTEEVFARLIRKAEEEERGK